MAPLDKKVWTLKNIQQLKAEKMFAGGELKGRGKSTGTVKQCLTSREMKGVSVEYVTIHPHQKLRAHVHHRTEAFLIIIRGSGIASLNRKSVKLKKGSLIYIPPGTTHGFRTKNNYLEFIAVQRPPVLALNGREDLEIIKKNKF